MPAFERGLDVLLDIALLARTDFVFKGASAVGEWALWLNPELDCWDAAIDATYRPGPGSHHAPAWELLNPAQIAPGRWWLVRRARGLRRLGSRAREHLGRLRRRGHSAPIQPDAGPKSR